jgi:Rieske Fe-S protein
MTASEDPTRRGFVGWLSTGLGALPFLGGLAVALRSASLPARTEGPTRLPLCKKSEVPATGLLARPLRYELRRGARVETVATTVFVTRSTADGAIVALSSRCTHLGCPVVHRPDDEAAPLHCPCHDAAFAADGRVLAGPPRRPLDRLTLEIPEAEDGLIHLVLA